MAQLVSEREPCDRGNLSGAKNLFVFIIAILSLILILPQQALAWGSVTHYAICRAAGGGEVFAQGGVAPDMIALYSVRTGDDSYDYAHNCYGGGREPVFGDLMATVSSRAFCRGWAAHQLADSVVHGNDGYSNTKAVFEGLPDRYRTTLNHGAVELIVDAIVLDESYGGDVELMVPDEAETIHATAVHFYNAALPAGTRIRRAAIINCHAAADLAYQWNLCLNTNKYLAQMLAEETWFPAVRRRFEDFRPLFAQSVTLVGDRAAVAPSRVARAASVWDRLAGLLPAGVARAAESDSGRSIGTGEPAEYYRFLALLSERARRIGNGRIDKKSVRQAVVELRRDNTLSDREKVWAAALDGMTDKRVRRFSDVNRGVRETGRRLSREGAAGGRSDSALPYLIGAAMAAGAIVAAVWMLRRR